MGVAVALQQLLHSELLLLLLLDAWECQHDTGLGSLVEGGLQLLGHPDDF